MVFLVRAIIIRESLKKARRGRNGNSTENMEMQIFG